MPDRKTRKAPTRRARKGGRSSSMTGSYFLSLELENVRCFSERQTLDLSDGNGRPAPWTILLGENGTGKTTILQLLAIFHWANMFGPRRTSNAVGLEMIYKVINGYLLSESLVRNPAGPWPEITVNAVYDVSGLDAAMPLGANSSIRHNTKNAFLFRSTTDERALPACYTYGIDRRLRTPALSRDGSGDLAESFFLSDDLVDSQEWLLRLDYTASKASRIQRRQKERLE